MKQNKSDSVVYLLHFDTPYKHAKHYLGFVETGEGLQARLTRHAKGQGARLMEIVSGAGIGFKLARSWQNATRDFERKLKNRKETPQLCPICNPDAMQRAKELPSTNHAIGEGVKIETPQNDSQK